MKTTRQIYCQYLLSSQINYTCTNLADHTEGIDHHSVYRYLKGEKLPPVLIWEKVKDHLVPSANGYLIFDDTVLDKSYSLLQACAANIAATLMELSKASASSIWFTTTPQLTTTGSSTTASSIRSASGLHQTRPRQ